MGYYDDFYGELSEFEQQVDDFKRGLLSSVKEEFIKEMERLRKENSELQKVKVSFAQIKQEYLDKEKQLVQERKAIYEQGYKDKGRELFGGYYLHDKCFIVASDTERVICDRCNGKKKVKATINDLQEQTELDCPKCKGYGAVVNYHYKPLKATVSQINYKNWHDAEHEELDFYVNHRCHDGKDITHIWGKNKNMFKTMEECQKICDEKNNLEGDSQ